MTSRPAVIEIIVTTALRVAVPKASGDDPRTAAETRLRAIEGVRHVTLEELGGVTPTADTLHVDCYARLTFHLDYDTVEDPGGVVRARLDETSSVMDLKTFTVASGPYRIESW